MNVPFGPAADARRPTLGRLIAIVAAYALVTLVIASPFVDYRHLASTSYGGDVDLVTWTLAWDCHALLNWLPLFQANVFYPAPQALQYNEHLAGIALFYLPPYAVSGNPVLAYNIVWLAAWLLNAIAAYMLARRYVRDDLAAFAGGLVFAFSFFRVHHFAHLGLAWTFWLPLSLLAIERWYRQTSWRTSALVLVTVVLQVAANWYLAVLILLTDGIFLACLVAFPDRRGRPGADTMNAADSRRAVLTARHVYHGAAILLILAAMTWPLARHYQGLPRSTIGEAAKNSADIHGYLVPPEHSWMGHLMLVAGSHGPRWLYGERTTFLGFTALGLSLAGIAALRDRRRAFDVPRSAVVFFPLLAVVALLLSFGPATPGSTLSFIRWSPFDLVAGLPGVGGARAPARFALLVVLAMSVLVALGAGWLHRRFGRRGRLATLLLVCLMLSEWYVVGFGRPAPHPIPEVYRYLAHKPARAVVSLPIYRATPLWPLDLAYLYYSTAHWHPIVNGGGRAEPDNYFSVVGHMQAFAGPNSARTMRQLGVDYVVLHDDGSEAVKGMLQEALGSGAVDFRLERQFGNDYLFQVVTSPVR